MEGGFSLANLEKEFNILAKKYKLPSFRDLNEDFEIDKIDRETFCVLRLVRKVMMEKVVNTMNFLEMLLNPTNTPRVYLPYIRAMSADDRKNIETLYVLMGTLSVSSLDLEVDYSEKREADMIKSLHEAWSKSRPQLRAILAHMRKPSNGNTATRKEKSYFG